VKGDKRQQARNRRRNDRRRLADEHAAALRSDAGEETRRCSKARRLTKRERKESLELLRPHGT